MAKLYPFKKIQNGQKNPRWPQLFKASEIYPLYKVYSFVKISISQKMLKILLNSPDTNLITLDGNCHLLNIWGTKYILGRSFLIC